MLINCNKELLFFFVNQSWKICLGGVEVTWAKNEPKQTNGVDCGLYFIRYVHYIATNDPMKFTPVCSVDSKYLQNI